jgi:sulfide:quinone oxidoreductase
MADVLILGGGFSGVVAAERLVNSLGDEHQVTLVSRDSRFVFYPDLVQVAFGKTEPTDVSFDLREAMLDRRIRFIKGEVARVLPDLRRVVVAHGDVEGTLSYDYLVFAMGRRLATEEVPGFYEHANHLLSVKAALDFGEKVRTFTEGRAVFGQCPGARLPVPVYEAAFAFARMLEERGDREKAMITIVSPDPPGYQLGDSAIARALRTSLDSHLIEFLPDFPITEVRDGALVSATGRSISYRLLMLIPPFRGSAVARSLGQFPTDNGYLNVDWSMRVINSERVYAAGDCVNFRGPKMAHVAVHQAEVAAANIELEINGLEPSVAYNHELMMVIDEGGPGTIFVKQDLGRSEPSTVKTGRFWSWAKWAHDKYWQAQHS